MGKIVTVLLLMAVIAIMFAMKGIFLRIMADLFTDPTKRRRR